MIKTIKRNRLSSVSVALRNVQKLITSSDAISKPEIASDLYTVSIANSKNTRQMAYQLAYEVYLAKGYIPKNSCKMLISNSDFIADTCTININDGTEIVASVTLNFQGKTNLPCQELYSEEIAPLINQNAKLVEITRLVIKEDHRHSNYLLAQLFQATFIYAYQIKNVSELVIEVNPRHVAFYQRLLGFSVLGGEKECERVNNAPAFLLHLDLNDVNKTLQNHYQNNLAEANKFKFFKFALPLEKANTLKNNFKNSFTPISFSEKLYFGNQQIKTSELTGAF